MANTFNFLAGFNGSTPVLLPCPSVCEWGLQDVSASDAGRDEAIVMHKGRKGQARTYKLAWNGVTPAEASTILKAFNPEYAYFALWDPMEGKYQKRYYYTGDRSAPFKIWTVRKKYFTNITLTIIEADPSLASDFTP